MAEISLEAMAGIALGVAGILMGYMRNMRKDICRDITNKHEDIKQRLRDMEAEHKLTREETREYREIRDKLDRQLAERLSRIEGRTIERDAESDRNSGEY